MHAPIEINPGKSSAYDKDLFDFLQNQYNTGVRFWNTQDIYTLKDGTNFSLTNEIVWTQRKLNQYAQEKQGLRFQVIGEELGKGGFGTVYDTKATIALGRVHGNPNQSAIKDKYRAIKFQPINTKEQEEALMREFELSSLAGHLHIRKPTIIGKSSYTAMKLIRGEELFKLVDDDLSGRKKLSLLQRKKLSLNLLTALKNQVIDKGIVHRDLKEENIMVDSKTMEVFIIDFGLSKLENEKPAERVGTPSRIAPEIWHNEDYCYASSKSDIWAMSRILAFLWGDDADKHFSDHDYDIWMKISKNLDFSSMYTRSIPGMRTADRHILISRLKAMSNEDPDDRLTIDESIEAFCNLFNVQQITDVIPLNSKLHNNLTKIDSYLSILEKKCVDLKKEAESSKPTEKKLLVDAEVKIRLAIEGVKNKKKMFLESPYITDAYEGHLNRFKQESRQIIVDTRKELAQYRNSNYIFAEIGMVFACLIIFYPLAAVIHEKITGYGSFFGETKSTKAAVELIAEIDKLEFENLPFTPSI